MTDKIAEKKDNKNASFNLIEVIVIIIITSLVVGVVTSVVVRNSKSISDKVPTFNKKNNLEEFEEAYNNIINSYVEKVDENKLIEAAIEGMYNYLSDPYTTYIDEDTSIDLTDRLNGEYYGLGIEFYKDEDGFKVAEVFNNSPAQKADIKSGDILIKINDKIIENMLSTEVAKIIKTSNFDKIKLTIMRNGKEIEKEINLGTIIIPSISKEKYEDVGYIKVSTFSNTTYKQFLTALNDLEKDDIKGLIIDLRNNGGGYLDTAVDIASLFLEKGKNIYGLQIKNKTEFFKDETSESRKYKIVVLINGGSASASEILAAALKESYGATLVGTKSYGKGSVQESNTLKSGAFIKYTFAYWLTPKGNNINNKGIEPDIIEEDNSLQIEKAIEAIK